VSSLGHPPAEFRQQAQRAPQVQPGLAALRGVLDRRVL